MHDLLLKALAFGIVAPEAPGRTTLQKDSSPYARPIVNGVSPDIKDAASRHIFHHHVNA